MIKKEMQIFIYISAVVGFSLTWNISHGSKRLFAGNLETSKDIISEISNLQTKLSQGFDLFSTIKRQEYSEKIVTLKKELQSSFYCINATNKAIDIKTSYANEVNDEWSSTKIQQISAKSISTQVFIDAPLYASDRTIFINDLPFMFLCKNSSFATVSHFRRGGIIFSIDQPNTKVFDYNAHQYIVSWKQGLHKAQGVFDIFIKIIALKN